MPRSAMVLAGVLLPVVAALSGCSSSSGDERKPVDEATAPAAPAASASASASASGGQHTGGTRGRLDYTGSLSGGFDVTTSVGCRILAGRLVAVTAPDADEEAGFAAPSFDVTTGGVSVVALVTPDNRSFSQVGAKGVSTAKQDGVWTVTVSGTELRAADASGGSVTVDGHLTCTTVHGTEAP